MSHYESLGVPSGADDATIRNAYRKKAQKLHPDKPGGDAQAFYAVQIAYDVLSDRERRERYDRFGDSAVQDTRGMALAEVAKMLVQLVEQCDVEHQDMVELLRLNVQNNIDAREAKKRDYAGKIAKLERAIKRFKKKAVGENMMVAILQGHINTIRNATAALDREILQGKDMLAIILEYSYQADRSGGGPVPMMTFNSFRR